MLASFIYSQKQFWWVWDLYFVGTPMCLKFNHVFQTINRQALRWQHYTEGVFCCNNSRFIFLSTWFNVLRNMYNKHYAQNSPILPQISSFLIKTRMQTACWPAGWCTNGLDVLCLSLNGCWRKDHFDSTRTGRKQKWTQKLMSPSL